MDTQAPKPPSQGGTFKTFITSLAAAICLGGTFGVVFAAFVVAATSLFNLGQMFLWVGAVLAAAFTVWLSVWSFSRTWYVERRLAAGLDVDEPSFSIMANWRGDAKLAGG
jgi:hypothetical protein